VEVKKQRKKLRLKQPLSAPVPQLKRQQMTVVQKVVKAVKAVKVAKAAKAKLRQKVKSAAQFEQRCF
jgi:hypothetical protein